MKVKTISLIVLFLMFLFTIVLSGNVLGSQVQLNSSQLNVDAEVSDENGDFGIAMRWDISSIHTGVGTLTIDNATLCLSMNLASTSLNTDVRIRRLVGSSWNYASLDGITKTNSSNGFWNGSLTASQGVYKCVEVTSQVVEDVSQITNTTSLLIDDVDNTFDGDWNSFDGGTMAFGKVIDYADFVTSTGTGDKPLLFIDYTIVNDLSNVSLDSPVDYNNDTDGSVIFNFTVTGNGVDTCELWGNWSNGWHLNQTITGTSLNNGSTTGTTEIIIEEGNYFWGVECNGSQNTVIWTENRTITIDTLPPLVIIDHPFNSTYSYNESIDFNITVIDNTVGVNTMWYNIDGTTLPTSNMTVIVNTTLNLSEGSHTVFLFANDSLGQENLTSITFKIDISSPILQIISPTNSQYNYNESLLLNYSISDDSEVNATWYNLDEGDNITVTGSTTFNVSEGIHTLYLYANDSLGWEGYASTQFLIDIAKPSLQLEYPLDNAWATNTLIQFNFTANDTDLDTCELWTNTTGSWELNQTFTVNDGSLFNDSITNSSFLTLIDERRYYWGIRCNDSGGNIVWSLSNYTFGIDSVNPTLMIVYPENGTSFTSSQTNCNEPRDLNFSWVDGWNVNITYQLLHSNYGVEINNVSINSNTTFSPARCTTGSETYTLLMLATDEANNQNITEITFTNTYQTQSNPSSNLGGGTTLIITDDTKRFCGELTVIPSQINLDSENRVAEAKIMNNFNETVNIILQLDENLTNLIQLDGGGYVNPNSRTSIFLTLKEPTNTTLNGYLNISTDKCEGTQIAIKINEKNNELAWINKITEWLNKKDFQIGKNEILRAYWVIIIFILIGITIIITKAIRGFMLKLLIWLIASTGISYGIGTILK